MHWHAENLNSWLPTVTIGMDISGASTSTLRQGSGAVDAQAEYGPGEPRYSQYWSTGPRRRVGRRIPQLEVHVLALFIERQQGSLE